MCQESTTNDFYVLLFYNHRKGISEKEKHFETPEEANGMTIKVIVGKRNAAENMVMRPPEMINQNYSR